MPIKYINLDTAKIKNRGLKPYLKELSNTLEDCDYKKAESFVNVPFDEKNITKVVELKNALVTDNLKYIILIGIGGSSLGTKAIYDALKDKMRPTKIIFLDTINPNKYNQVSSMLKSLSPQEVLINAVTKSGTTLETTTNLNQLINDFPNLKIRVVITTTKDSPLIEDGDFKSLEIPKEISGRFSVFTPVGLFPLTCVGIDILSLLEGAMSATKENVGAQSNSLFTANFLYKNYKKNKNIHELFTFEPNLESLGKWYEQVISESLGKRGKGITPVTSIGSNDLHSKAQLDIGGPKNKMATFVVSKDNLSKEKTAIYNAAVQMYKNNGVPLIELEFDEINASNLGYFMQHKMIETVLLAKLMGINAYNQPNVEEYKIKAKEYL